MLDWEDEELASILWDEVPEAAVPYPEDNEGSQSGAPSKELTNELSSHDNEIKRTPDKAGFRGLGNETVLVVNSNSEKTLSSLCTVPWKDPNLSTTVRRSHYLIDTSPGSSAGTIQNVPSSGDGVAQVDEESESSQKQFEEQKNGDFIDYSWADIESFGDLDKIFSNDDPIFGSAEHGSVDELWSDSKDAGYILENPFASPVESLIKSYKKVDVQNKVRTESIRSRNQLISDHDNMGNCISYDPSDIDVPTDGSSYTGGKPELKLKETIVDRTENNTTLGSPNSSSATFSKLSNKVNKEKKFKNQKSLDQKMKGKLLLSSFVNECLPGNQLQNFGKQEATSIAHSYQFSEASQLRHITVQPKSDQTSVPCENMYNQYPDMPMLPRLHYGVDSLQHKFHDYKVAHDSSLLRITPLKPLFMTPQEKIDKLRRRQQMQAMLAIKKQQEELGQQASGFNMDRLMRCSSEKKISSEFCKVVNELPVENSVLTQLQDIISKLDIRVRLCIRDSLFRLATSALQRHYPGDNVSANNNAHQEDHKLPKEEISNHLRDAGIVDAETRTNLIDRTVARLLFHRPFNVITEHSETLNSEVSTQPLPECKSDALVILPSNCSKDSTEPKLKFPCKESESSFPTMEPQVGTEFLDSSCMGVSENGSNHEIHAEKLSTKY